MSSLIQSLYTEFLKIAELKTTLQPHQQRVVDRMKLQSGLVVAHGLGSGKTLTSIAVQDALNTPATVVVPASLIGNYEKERDKHLQDPKQPASIESLQNITRNKKIVKAPLLIIDEAHRLREPTTQSYKMMKLTRDKSDKALLLTGSPFYNHPADIASLVNLVADTKPFPDKRTDFEYEYINEKTIPAGIIGKIKGIADGVKPEIKKWKKEQLRGILNRWVDYHPGSTEEFPDVIKEEHIVPMTSKQLEVYDTVIAKAPAWVAHKIKEKLPPNKQEVKQLNAYLTGARQVSNTTAPYISEGEPEMPKVQKAFEELKRHFDSNPKAKAVVYSNFLDAGIKPYKELLERENIPHGQFTGEMKKREKDQLVKDYNSGKIKTLLISSAGGEGLDLKGTRLIQMLEPHWNDEKLKQVEGRGIRYKSHENLPPEERKVVLQRYYAVRPPTALQKLLKIAPDGSVDEYLSQLSKDKEELINQFKDLLIAKK